MKVVSGSNLGLRGEYPKKVFWPVFFHGGTVRLNGLSGATSEELFFSLNPLYVNSDYPFVYLQVEIQSCVGFFPSRHVRLPEPTLNIPVNLHGLHRSGNLPDTLVLCLPQLRASSAAHKTIPALQEIPIRALEHSTAGQSLSTTHS